MRQASWRATSRTIPELYARKGWTMFRSIDRVYDASRARDEAGFRLPDGLCQRAGRAGARLDDGAGSLRQRRRQVAIAGGAPLIGEAEQLRGILGDAVELGIVGLREIDDLLVIAEKILDRARDGGRA